MGEGLRKEIVGRRVGRIIPDLGLYHLIVGVGFFVGNGVGDGVNEGVDVGCKTGRVGVGVGGISIRYELIMFLMTSRSTLSNLNPLSGVRVLIRHELKVGL